MEQQENKIRKIVRDVIQETSLSRVWQHINNKESFGVVSAYKSELSLTENKQRHEQLRKDIKKLYGYIELKSGYTYFKDELEKQIEEQSFFVPKIKFNDLISLGIKYEQETVIYKDENQFILINPKTKQIYKDFNKDKNKSITFNPEVLKHSWSQFVKSKNKNNIQPFAFTLKEEHIPSRLDSIIALGNKTGLAKVTYIDLF